MGALMPLRDKISETSVVISFISTLFWVLIFNISRAFSIKIPLTLFLGTNPFLSDFLQAVILSEYFWIKGPWILKVSSSYLK